MNPTDGSPLPFPNSPPTVSSSSSQPVNKEKSVKEQPTTSNPEGSTLSFTDGTSATLTKEVAVSKAADLAATVGTIAQNTNVVPTPIKPPLGDHVTALRKKEIQSTEVQSKQAYSPEEIQAAKKFISDGLESCQKGAVTFAAQCDYPDFFVLMKSNRPVPDGGFCNLPNEINTNFPKALFIPGPGTAESLLGATSFEKSSPAQMQILKKYLQAAFMTDKEIVVARLSDGEHATCVAFKSDGTFKIIDSMSGRSSDITAFTKEINSSPPQIKDANGKPIQFRGEFHLTQAQQDTDACLRFSTLYAYQMAKENDLNGYQSVNAAIQANKLQKFEDFRHIDPSHSFSEFDVVRDMNSLQNIQSFLKSWGHRSLSCNFDDIYSIPVSDLSPATGSFGDMAMYVLPQSSVVNVEQERKKQEEFLVSTGFKRSSVDWENEMKKWDAYMEKQFIFQKEAIRPPNVIRGISSDNLKLVWKEENQDPIIIADIQKDLLKIPSIASKVKKVDPNSLLGEEMSSRNDVVKIVLAQKKKDGKVAHQIVELTLDQAACLYSKNTKTGKLNSLQRAILPSRPQEIQKEEDADPILIFAIKESLEKGLGTKVISEELIKEGLKMCKQDTEQNNIYTIMDDETLCKAFAEQVKKNIKK